MEQLLHYVWKHKLLPLQQLTATDRRTVEVIAPGMHNRKDGGPDFFNAKMKIDGTLWVGNVEIHSKASDWYRHGHDHDSAYDNVVLHVVETADRDVQNTKVTPYWETHYTFGSTSTRTQKNLSAASINLLMINTAIPTMFAYGRHTMNDALCDRAIDLLDQLKAENNHITRMWQECGLAVTSAGDSQALIQLKKEYCDKRKCLRCRIGYEYLRRQK